MEEGKHLSITVDNDTAELIIDSRDKGEMDINDQGILVHKEFIPVYKEFTGKQIVSYWAANNHQGYFDSFAIGIDEFLPTLLITCDGSSLDIRLCNSFKSKMLSRI